MAVDAVTSSSTSASATAGRGMAAMRSEDFFKLLIAELQYQDPFEPMDNAKMVEQIAGIRNIEASTNMSDALQSVTRQQNFAMAGNLIGKMVKGVVKDTAGKEWTIEGVVTGVRFETNGVVVLELDTGEALPLEAVTQIRGLEQGGSSGASAGGGASSGTSGGGSAA